jgi:hypothetical protein
MRAKKNPDVRSDEFDALYHGDIGILNGAESQALFESLFDHQPKVDVRTPEDVKRQKAIEQWR